MDVEVNLIGVLAAAVVAMVIGSVWYSNAVFGKQWRKLEDINEAKGKEGMGKGIAGMIVISLLAAYVLAHIAYLSDSFFVDSDFQSAAVSTAFWVWLGFFVPALAGNSLFNQRPWKSTIIHLGNWLVTLLAMGLTIGLIGL
jgi:hypothetical protein